MIELGTIPIKNETSIVEARNKMRLLAEELQFDSITTTRLATMTSELSRRMVATSQMSDIKVALDKRDGSYGLVLLFISGQSLKTLDLNVLEAVFDDVGVAQSVDSLELIRTFKFLKDPEFEPTKEFINKAKRLVQPLSREELYLQLNEYAEILEERNAKITKANLELQKDIAKRKRAEEELERFLHDMGERIKELTCLYGVADSIRERETLEEIFRDVAALIHPAWHYPEITRARLRFDKAEYVSEPFDETEWKQSSDIVVNGEPRGVIEVYYLEPRPELDEGPFLNEERNLIEGITKALSEAIGRKQAEEELKEYSERLEEMVEERTAKLDAVNKELEAFSYSVSHDLRAPLRAIDGFGGTIMEDYSDKLDSEGQRLLRVIRKNTRHMGQLIDDLLAFSRTGRKTMGSTKLDMSVIAKTVYEELNSLTSERKLRFEIKRLPSGHGDWPMMHQVWMNLLSNAIKFTGPVDNPEIEVGGRTEGDEKVYWVRDNGVGFDMKYADKLFTVFQRLHSVEEFEGTGIGLALVQRIIHRHGGRVWAEGEINKGATFYFTLLKKEGDLR